MKKFFPILLLLIISCAHTGPPVYSEEEAKLADKLALEAEAYEEYIEKHPEKDIQNFHYNDEWMEKQAIRLKKITTRICKANNFQVPKLEVDPAEQFRLFGRNLRIINAATNGTLIFSTAAMMKLMDDDDELAAVIGHELAHIHRHHITNRILRGLPVAILSGISEASSPGSGRGISELGSIALAEFNRDEEREADVYGVIYIKNGGFNYHKAPNVWRKMAIQHPDNIHNVFYFGTSHPITTERLIRLEKVTKDLDAGEDPIKKYLPKDEELKR